MASLASPKSFQASLVLPKATPTPFNNLTKAIILSRRINAFAYFVEANQVEEDVNLLLCIRTIVKLEEEFEDIPNHGSYDYAEAAIEITKMYIQENAKHFCAKISQIVKKQLLVKLSQPGSFSSFKVDFYPLRNECIKILESKYLLNFLDDQSRKIQFTWKELLKSTSLSDLGKSFIEILETKMPNFCLQQHNIGDEIYEQHNFNNENLTYNTEQVLKNNEKLYLNSNRLHIQKKISGISLQKDNRLSTVRKEERSRKKKKIRGKRRYEYKYTWNFMSGNRPSVSEIFTRLGEVYVTGLAKSIEELSIEGFTEDVLRSFGSEQLDHIIGTSYKAYSSFVESFLIVLHNHLFNHRCWSIATKESWETFFHIKYYLYLFSMDIVDNDADSSNSEKERSKIRHHFHHVIDKQNINELNFYDEIFRKSALRLSNSPQNPQTITKHTHKDCMTGKSFVDFLVNRPHEWFWNLLVIEFNAWDGAGNPVPTRWESALFAQELLDREYLIDVLNLEENPKVFLDSAKSFYRFSLIPSALCFVPCFTTNGRNEYLIAIARTMSLPRYGVLKNHRHGFRSIHNCFTAKDFIAFIMDYGIENYLDHAVQLGKEFRRKELINIIGSDGKHHHTDFEQSSRKLYIFNSSIVHPCN
eukprot:g7490.t1